MTTGLLYRVWILVSLMVKINAYYHQGLKESSIANIILCDNAFNRVRKIIYCDIDDHIIANNNLLNYESTFEYILLM